MTYGRMMIAGAFAVASVTPLLLEGLHWAISIALTGLALTLVGFLGEKIGRRLGRELQEGHQAGYLHGRIHLLTDQLAERDRGDMTLAELRDQAETDVMVQAMHKGLDVIGINYRAQCGHDHEEKRTR